MRAVLRLSSVVFVSSLLTACGGGGDDGGDDVAEIDPAGTHTKFVADTLLVPSTSVEAQSVDFDLDGDGTEENALGGLLAALAGTANLDIRTTVLENVEDGTVLVLADLQATELAAATGVGLRVYLGSSPNPAPCLDPEDPTSCGQHLQGGASFEIDDRSPQDAVVVGQIVGGRFTGGPGTVRLEIPLATGTDPVVLDRIGARMEATVGAGGTTLADGKLGGASTDADIRAEVLPSVGGVVGAVIAPDCTGAFPDCCADEASRGARVLGFFNTDESADCVVTLEELENNDIIAATLLTPDLDLLDADGNYDPGSDGVNDSLSLGVGFTAVSASYELPAGL
jgi:hypothetical protein